jgi:prepilin-type N-terminal cleavage/methylation domain-containing protein
VNVARGQRGFTLIEIMAAITVFSIVTLGLVPLLGASLRGTSLAQSETVAQNSAREMMERIQGLKWFTSWNAKPSKVDVLDLFYPQVSSTGLLAGQSYATVTSYAPLTVSGGSGGVFSTQCPNAGNPACQVNLPAGYTMTIQAAFVKPNLGTSPQTYQIHTPPADYAYNSSTGKDAPPAQLLHVDVAVTRTVNGKIRTSQLQSIVGERKFTPGAAVVTGTAPPSAAPAGPPGAAKISATAKLDYLYQIQTGFSSGTAGTGCPTAPCASDLEATILNSESTIQSSETVSADTTVRAADVSVVRSYPPPQTPPASPPPDLASFSGVTHAVHAPPAAPGVTLCSPLPSPCNTITNVTHPDFSSAVVSSISGTKINSISADTPGGNPTTQAELQLFTSTCGTVDGNFVHPQADLLSSGGYLRLSNTTPVQLVRSFQQSSCSFDPTDRNRGGTLATSTALTPAANRYVQARASAHLANIQWLKLNYSNTPHLFGVSDFDAVVDCKSTPSGGATATATWSGTFIYRFDHKNDGNVPSSRDGLIGAQVTFNRTGNDTISARFDGVNVTTVSTPNAIEWLKANNPVVYDGNSVCCTSTSDIYLFTERDASGTITKKGYLNSAVENKSPSISVSSDGRTTSVSFDAFLRFDTHQLHASYPDSSYSISIGKMSCEAVDNR